MAKVSELLRRVNDIVDDTIDTIKLIDWFNQCQNNILDLLYLPTRKTITKTESGFAIPSDYNGELRITDPLVETYDIYDNTISFDGEDGVTSITVTYNRNPVAIQNNPDQIPDIPVQFHDIYVFYAAMTAMHPEEEQTRYQMYEGDYLRMRGQISKFMGKTRQKPSAWKVVR